MSASLPSDADRYAQPPALPLVEATLSLVQEMVRADYQLARRDALVTLAGFKALEHHE